MLFIYGFPTPNEGETDKIWGKLINCALLKDKNQPHFQRLLSSHPPGVREDSGNEV